LSRIAIVAVALFASSVQAADDPDVAGLLRKVSDAYGGSSALAECPGFRARGRVLSLADGVNGTVIVSLSLNGALRVEIRYPSRTETRILSGKLAWDGGRERQKPSDRDMASSIRLQYHRLAAPFELAAASAPDLEARGTSDEGWIRLRRQWSDALSTTYEIDPESGRIRRIRGVLTTGAGELEFVSECSDFREVGGLQFPFRTTTWVGERVAAETIFERVTIEADFPATSFVPAGSGSDI